MKLIFPYNAVRPATPAILGASAKPADKWHFITTFKDMVTTYKTVKEVPNEYKEVSFDEKEFFGIVGSQMQIDVWDLVLEMAADIEASPRSNPKLELDHLFIEADAAIVDDIVPEGVRLADGSLTFNDFTVSGDSDVPFSTSLDGSRVIIRCALGGAPVNHTELLSWRAFRDSSDKNIRILTYFEQKALVTTPEYSDNSEIL